MSLPREITVWACPTCGYWRDQQTTGRHQTDNPDDPRGRMVVHELERTVYVLPAALSATVAADGTINVRGLPSGAARQEDTGSTVPSGR